MSPNKKESQTISLEQDQFNALLKTMQNLVKVYAAAQIKHDKGTFQNAKFLRVFDFTEQEIADLLGISQPAVHQALFKTKKEKEKVSLKGSDDATKET